MWWQLKWAKNAAFGLLPFAGAVRRSKRRLRPYPTDVPPFTLEEGFRLLELLREAGFEVRGATVIEIGTGWRPIIPLLFSLSGAARLVSVDTQRLMDGPSFAGTAISLSAHAAEVADRLGLDEQDVRHFLVAPPGELADSLARFRMEYYAPCDLVCSPLPDGAFDGVISRAVLEHVPPDVLRPLLRRVFRLLRPGGWTCHAVDNSDHWSHGDRRLSRVNFLRYSDRLFAFLNRFNALDYQNRLRHPEYVDFLRDAGFDILVSRSDPEPRALEDLKTLPLADRFRAFSKEDLARLDSYFLARRPPG
ncbi:MAG TPA: methyltransferase domain-containing protein [Gemmataceae bacterium]|nr:methyltransferase domain-containing protein [Gemmataceae bacterium]